MSEREQKLTINEIYFSVQGESTWAGLPCVFVRLTFCDLRCTYCDTEYAFYKGEKQSLGEIVDAVLAYDCPLVEITGGEPLLYGAIGVFFFLLVNNAFASIPGIQFPTFSRASMAYALAALSWVIYNGVGIHKHGLVGYLKLQSVPSGVSPLMYPLLVPLEFFSNILVRPATLALRLFANMFAGHLLLILFSTGGLFLLEYGGIGYVAGPLAWVLAIAISFLELLVQFLQAYVFTLLNAMYISGALADEH